MVAVLTSFPTSLFPCPCHSEYFLFKNLFEGGGGEETCANWHVPYRLFSNEGFTHAFDERGQSGFARGEGAGIVILKPLSAAQRDRDPIHAVVANTGVNQDGKTQGITNPNGDAQEELIRKTYENAGIDMLDVGYVEMHGTGTKVGDPLEAAAVHRALTKNRPANDPIYIGSVKSNVGHLEGASGIVSLIKSAMMLEREFVLPMADFRHPNKKIPFDDWRMKITRSTRPFPAGKKYISISNYGFGGTNAHAIVGKAPRYDAFQDARAAHDEKEDGSASSSTADDSKYKVTVQEPVSPTADSKYKVVVVSGHSNEALQQRMEELSIYFEQRPEAFEKMLFGNVAYTLGSRRTHLPFRLALTVASNDEFSYQLQQRKGKNASRIGSAPTIGFVFTGQGAQWARMGMGLMKEYPVFAQVIHEADRTLSALGAPFSMLEEMEKEASVSNVNAPHISQPACTVLQVALVALLKSWGITPSAVVGHSSGEIASAFAAGAFDVSSAVALAYLRGHMTLLLKQKATDVHGGMIAVGAGADYIKPLLEELPGYAIIACVNSPSSVTVSGDRSAIVALDNILKERQVFARQLKVDVAYHTRHMEIVGEDYLAAIDKYKPATQSSKTTFYSSVVGKKQPADLKLDASYWVANLTSPVLFAQAVQAMCSPDNEDRPNLLVEVGPHSALKGPVIDSLKSLGGNIASKTGYTPTIVRGADAMLSILATASSLYTQGASLDFTNVNFPHTKAKYQTVLTDLPKYPWQHDTRYWHEPRIAKKHLTRDHARNDILGVLANYSNDLEPTWRNVIRLDEIPWLRDHRMQDMVVFPFAGYVCVFIPFCCHYSLCWHKLTRTRNLGLHGCRGYCSSFQGQGSVLL